MQRQAGRQPHAEIYILAGRLALQVNEHPRCRHGLHAGRVRGVRHRQRLQLLLVHAEERQNWHEVRGRILLDGAGDKLEEEPHEAVTTRPQPAGLHGRRQLADDGGKGDKLEEDEEDEVGGEVAEEVSEDLGGNRLGAAHLAHLQHFDEQEDQLLLQRGAKTWPIFAFKKSFGWEE